MSNFKPGDKVRVIGGPRAGSVATIVDKHITGTPVDAIAQRWTQWGVKPGMVTYKIDLPSLVSERPYVIALPHWLAPFYDGNEKGEWTEELKRLCFRAAKAEVL